MFHFIQRCCQLPFKLQKLSLPLMEGAVGRVQPYPRLRPLRKNHLPVWGRSWPAPPAPACWTGARSFHLSPCCFEKKKPAAATPKPPRTLGYLPATPKPARCLAALGMIPFAAPPLIMVATKSYLPILAFTQMAYGTCLLAFLGGVRWGYALPEGSPAKPDLMNLAVSTVPLFFAWFAFILSEGLSEAIVLLIVGFGVTLHNELFLLNDSPNWFKALEIVLTLVVAISLIATLLLQDVYPEKGPKRPGKI
ncbi:LOW QUALITY PROTEIN: transmembrane protein 69 [Tachyglossus aculeatus]|uniref:LOW QUALITY PROTEIN: transmembrane protein 69 n=1 Tax=Tachyglossus aculeatus TaxID=9261 RepID=UPI0018F5AD22|nr:LOW QUALITY PROTEIN: transmembrane protein 69 [Tachyglossus aculeatus]